MTEKMVEVIMPDRKKDLIIENLKKTLKEVRVQRNDYEQRLIKLYREISILKSKSTLTHDK